MAKSTTAAKPEAASAPVNSDRDRIKEHARSMLATINKGYTISGLRMHDPKKPENGLVVTFDEKEAAAIVAAVTKVLRGR